MAKVLIVDDDEEIRVLLDEVLQIEGFHVNVARHGKEALEILQREQGWVVLLDVNMPEMDGYEVVRRLKDHPAWLDDNRVVLMSAGRHLAAAHLLPLSEVVIAIVPKPFELDTLLEVVQRLASGKETSEGWDRARPAASQMTDASAGSNGHFSPSSAAQPAAA